MSKLLILEAIQNKKSLVHARGTRRRCYRTAPALAEQARRVVASLRAHPGRTLAHYALPDALARVVEAQLANLPHEESVHA